jgi:hypothetical protein
LGGQRAHCALVQKAVPVFVGTLPT